MGTIGTRFMITISGEKTGQREEDKRFPIVSYFEIGRFIAETITVGD